MDNLGDWIYIIFILIAAVSGIFSSSKKKKRPTDVLAQPGYEDEIPAKPANQKSFWDIFEEELEGRKPVTETVVSPPEPKKNYNSRTEKKKVERSVNKKKEEPSIYSKYDFSSHNFQKPTGPILGEVEENENYVFQNESFDDLNDLRKAIVYTEILNRRY